MLTETSPVKLAERLLSILDKDLGERLLRIDAYLHNEHDDPYMPNTADSEYRLLAKRAVSNWMPLLVNTPAQALYVDAFRRSNSDGPGDTAPEWEHWEHSRLDARQSAIYRGALTYGHSFVLTEDVKGKVTSRGLSALSTAALFEDPANDIVPYAVIHRTKMPRSGKTDGEAILWVKNIRYPVLIDKGSGEVRLGESVKTGTTECPVTRFAAIVDLEGRTIGVVEPMIPLQNRINQTVFDLLVAQTYGSFVVRTVSGMAPPMQMEPELDVDGEVIGAKPVIDPNTGQPMPMPIDVNAKRFLFAESADAKWGSLDATPLDGYISSIDMSIRHLAAVSQTPPHHLLGQIANLSAEALLAAETSLARMVAGFQSSFGESWERVFQVAAEISGDESWERWDGEVVWRDMESRSLAQAADALGKLTEQLQIPSEGLWHRVPGATTTEVAKWLALKEEADEKANVVEAVQRARTRIAPVTSPVEE